MSTPRKPRQFVFHLIALLIPVLFFVALELGLRAFDYGADLRLFIPAEETFFNDPYLRVNAHVAKRYFPQGYYTPSPPEEYFKATKPDNGYRIFVMGGSTAASWPYPRNVLFSRVLAQRLSDAFPDKYIEVVNTGIAAVNSFTLLDFVDEILAQQPDAILVYSGHNEFYGALGAGSTQTVGQARWMIKTYLTLSKLKTVQLIRSLVDSGKRWLSSGTDELSGHATLMSQMVGDNSIAYGSEIYENARKNYEANLSEILAKFNAADVPVIVSELVSNLRDHAPFISVDDGVHLPADLVYEWAGMMEQEGMYGMAREAYTWAKDLDGLRFRASEDFNQSIHKVAAQHDVPVVPMKRYFEAEARHGIVGEELMLEHLHPNVEGYLLMSEAFFDTIKETGLIQPHWDSDRLESKIFYRNSWPITPLDRALGELRMINLTDHYPYPSKGHEERTIANYNPRNIAEELALAVYTDKIPYVQAHIKLADYYESQGQPKLAFREYLAVMSAAPYFVDFYLMTADYLLKQEQFERALSILQSSLALKETGYAHKWIGQILVIMQRPAAARQHLETALVYFPEDVQTIYNLGFVDLVSGRLEGARVSMNLLENLAPDSPQLNSLKQLLAEQKNPPPAGARPGE